VREELVEARPGFVFTDRPTRILHRRQRTIVTVYCLWVSQRRAHLTQLTMPDARAILQHIAIRAMIDYGLEPELAPEALEETRRLRAAPVNGLRDLRGLLWSSIDNDESRDLDQLEVTVEEKGGVRLLVAVADVDSLVPKGSALDDHARVNTTSVYTTARIFPMLPEALSTDRTSLNEEEDRPALVVDMRVADDGGVTGDVYRAAVRNHAKLTYPAVAAWLDGDGPAPSAIGRNPDLERQLRAQDRLASLLRARREQDGALDFDRAEIKPVMADGTVKELEVETSNRARDIIESLMIAANGVTARFLTAHGCASIRRIVRSPKRWPRIVEVAATRGTPLPETPDVRALEAFLKGQRQADPEGFPDLSLSVLKLLGRGEYVADGPGGGEEGHFALAQSNYTHSTAPNRRFPDLVTQRLVKAALDGARAPYSLAELTPLAEHCTKQEDAATKVERRVRKSAAALWLADRIGQEFDAVVTGASDKGTWVRLLRPPVEGKLERGVEGLDVGDRLRVRLVRTDAERGFVDFVRV
jgi:VacB/RNase II family 3'-5' exoribonuclease